MSESNKITLETYNQHFQEYIEASPQKVSGGFKDWIDTSLKELPHDAQILEIGSAFGRDADYIESHGYVVDRTDATPAFVDLLQTHGHQAQQLNIITDEINKTYDLVIANAVFLHFTTEEMATAACKIYDALSDHGRLAFTLGQGEGDRWSSGKIGAPRYFNYWQKQELEQLLTDVGFSTVAIDVDQAAAGRDWLNVIAIK